ncbi:uncharacterized protein F4822DRAFT_383820 [Hypoxylon trugodes]|uniref:uncharacterized protein n=1 Tax=Hypoxylon trugodes TaxID=326681 RepID=UPI0021967377|nr:uncharacterized protein F4822DRAFT_383820 [Hypoxylon trugodes]KAI1393196.1 hypothetical protein F4822DRAFT_383820 [Hypoxylon trugodes]
MSKPDKYKTPEEKGVGVPGTANNDSGWKPYTVPYTGAGASRSANGDWVPSAQPIREQRSHAAPPLYIKRNREDKSSGKGKETSGQKKKTGNENQMFLTNTPLLTINIPGHNGFSLSSQRTRLGIFLSAPSCFRQIHFHFHRRRCIMVSRHE